MRSVLLCLATTVAAYAGCSVESSGSSSNESSGGVSGSAQAGGSAGSSAGSGGGAGDAAAGSSGSGASGGTAGSGGTAASGGSGATSGSGAGGSSIADAAAPDVRFTYDGPVNPDQDACAATTVEAELLPLAIYIMLDRSGSMNDNNKWNSARTAISSFVDDPGSVGLKVALGYFSGSGCTGYQIPAVAMGALPGNAAPIKNSLNTTAPSGATPTAGALNGLVAFCGAYQAANPTEKCVGILVSDGQPTDCSPTDATGLSNIAANARTTNNVQTFTMGMQGADFNVLNAIANGGGTDCDTAGPNSACDATGGAAAFLAALKAIQGQALGCEYQMPRTDAGIVNLDSVTVHYSANGVPPAQVVGRVNTQGDCAAAGGGWYYDNNVNPTKLTLCDGTCDVVKIDQNAKVDIALGCLGS